MTRRRKDRFAPFHRTPNVRGTRPPASVPDHAPRRVVIRPAFGAVAGQRQGEEIPRVLLAAIGRQSGDAVSHLVARRFNQEGLAAQLEPQHGGGRSWGLRRGGPRPHPAGGGAEADPGAGRDCHLVSFHPATRAAVESPMALPRVSTSLHPVAGSCTRPDSATQQTRTWCPTGTALPQTQGRCRHRHRSRCRRPQKS